MPKTSAHSLRFSESAWHAHNHTCCRATDRANSLVANVLIFCIVRFMANRAYPDKITLVVVTGFATAYNGNELRLKEFIEPGKP